MVFAHDVELALAAAVTLANSLDEPEAFSAVDDVIAFYREQDYSGVLAGDSTELRQLRPLLRELLTSDRDTAAEIVNRMLREGDARPQLIRHNGFDWHLHAVEADRPFAVRVAVETAMAMVDVIRADELSRLGVCADEDCDGIVLDLSRNRSRKFCSTACGNRAAVAAYRARQSGQHARRDQPGRRSGPSGAISDRVNR